MKKIDAGSPFHVTCWTTDLADATADIRECLDNPCWPGATVTLSYAVELRNSWGDMNALRVELDRVPEEFDK